MAYTKVHDPWEDFPSTDTPITAAALDQIEAGIADAAGDADTANALHTIHLDPLTDNKHGAEQITFDPTGNTIATGDDAQAAIDQLDAATAARPLTSAVVLKSLADAKGDLFVATANDTPARLAVGTNGHVLTADSAEATGVKWAAAAGGAGGHTIEDEGTPLTARTGLNFIGPGVSVTDDAANDETDVEIVGVYAPRAAANDQITPYSSASGTAWSTLGQLRFAKVYLRAGEIVRSIRTRPSTASAATIWRAALYTDNGGVPQNKITNTDVLAACEGTSNLTMLLSNKRGTVSSWSRVSNVTTVTTAAAHSLIVGDVITLQGLTFGAGGTRPDAGFTVATVPTSTTFTIANNGVNDSAAAGGVMYRPSGDYTVPTTGFYWIGGAITGGSAAMHAMTIIPTTQRAGAIESGFPVGTGVAYQDFIWSSGEMPASAFAGQAATNSGQIMALAVGMA